MNQEQFNQLFQEFQHQFGLEKVTNEELKQIVELTYQKLTEVNKAKPLQAAQVPQAAQEPTKPLQAPQVQPKPSQVQSKPLQVQSKPSQAPTKPLQVPQVSQAPQVAQPLQQSQKPNIQITVSSKQKSKAELLYQYEKDNGLMYAQKKQKIQEIKNYKAVREEKIRKNIQKSNKQQGKKPCRMPGCKFFFTSIRGENLHIIREHKILADRLGLTNFECKLCDGIFTCKTLKGFQNHQNQCFLVQKEILKAQGLIKPEEEINSEEELEFLECLKYN